MRELPDVVPLDVHPTTGANLPPDIVGETHSMQLSASDRNSSAQSERSEFADATVSVFDQLLAQRHAKQISYHREQTAEQILNELAEPGYRQKREQQYVEAFRDWALEAGLTDDPNQNIVLFAARKSFSELWDRILDETLPFPPRPPKNFQEWIHDESQEGGKKHIVPRGKNYDWRKQKCVVYLNRFLSEYKGRLILSKISDFDRALYLELRRLGRKHPEALPEIGVLD